MKAALRLAVVCMSATPLARGLTVSGLLLLLLTLITQRIFPWWTLGVAAQPRLSLELQALLTSLSSIASLLLFCSAAGMPSIIHRLAVSHQVAVLPHGRAKLLASAGFVVGGLSLMAATLAYLSWVDFPLELPPIFRNSLYLCLFAFTLSYLVIWLMGLYRTTMTVFVGVLLVILCLLVPMRLSLGGFIKTQTLIIPTLFMWSMIGGLTFMAPRLAAIASRPAFIAAAAGSRDAGRAPVDLLLGTASPWRYALAQVPPLFLAGMLIDDAPGMLVLFVLLATLTGATASLAAGRSRRLWLRSFATREELYRKVEMAYVRHGIWPLLVLILMFAAAAGYADLSSTMFGMGLLSIVLAMAAGIWLGLFCTQGLGWREGGCAIAVMGLLMAGAILCAAAPPRYLVLFALDLALLSLVAGFRYLAMKRWREIDWMRC